MNAHPGTVNGTLGCISADVVINKGSNSACNRHLFALRWAWLQSALLSMDTTYNMQPDIRHQHTANISLPLSKPDFTTDDVCSAMCPIMCDHYFMTTPHNSKKQNQTVAQPRRGHIPDMQSHEPCFGLSKSL